MWPPHTTASSFEGTHAEKSFDLYICVHVNVDFPCFHTNLLAEKSIICKPGLQSPIMFPDISLQQK